MQMNEKEEGMVMDGGNDGGYGGDSSSNHTW